MKHGANPNVVDSVGYTPLLYACGTKFYALPDKRGRERTAIVQALLEHGANLQVKDEKGRLPLELARHNYPGLVPLLLARLGTSSDVGKRVELR